MRLESAGALLPEGEEDVVAFRHLARHISKRYSFSSKQLADLIDSGKSEQLIPTGIFSDKLSCLEAICKYLKENQGLAFVKIARLLNRDPRTIWTTYSKAARKMPEALSPLEGQFIPISALANRKLSVLESLSSYLDSRGYGHREIATLLARDYKTIWITLNHAKRKV